MTRCDFCGFEFDPDCAVSNCGGCPLASNCAKLSCPRCGYEILPEARLIGFLRALREKTRQRKQTKETV